MTETYAYFCDRHKCDNCSYPMCKHTTDKRHRIYEEGSKLTEMQHLYSSNGVNYYMEFIRNSMDYLRDM